jgi:hypothetical protein
MHYHVLREHTSRLVGKGGAELFFLAESAESRIRDEDDEKSQYQ